MREKLTKMIEKGTPCPEDRDPFGECCDTCRYLNAKDCTLERLADHLLTNGVVIPVRCKDCKHTETDGSSELAIYCKKWDRWEMPEDFFCAFGESKVNDYE